MRVFTATLGTETNTFSPIPTGMDAFRKTLLVHAGEHPDKPMLFTAPLWAARQRARERNWELSEGLCAFAVPGGATTKATYEALREELLADLKKALPVDIVVLGLHGAMVADGYDDCEGDLLARVRELVGRDAVIGAELDPHCHLTDAMMKNSDVMVAFKEYPHVDPIERAFEVVDICADAAQKNVRPTMEYYDCRMFGIYHTPRQPMRGFVDKIKAMEGKDGVLSISIAHGFPWGDVPDMGTRVLVVTDNDPAKAKRLAEQLGQELIALRGTTAPEYLTIAQALDQAMAAPAGPIVIADSADNSGGGAPSDSTFVLREILARGICDVALGPMWDPVALQFCQEAGEGATLDLRLGGKTGPVSGDPLDVRVTVLKLVSNARQSFGQTVAMMGDAAAIRIEHARAKNVDIVVNEARTQAFGTDMFTGLGVDPTTKRIVVVKSSQHFHAAYAPIAREVLYIGGPGCIATDYSTFDFKRVQRPIWPLD
ncbi:MAG: M81 family metallopeptidase [Reyranellaceae bacterium]